MAQKPAEAGSAAKRGAFEKSVQLFADNDSRRFGRFTRMVTQVFSHCDRSRIAQTCKACNLWPFTVNAMDLLLHFPLPIHDEYRKDFSNDTAMEKSGAY